MVMTLQGSSMAIRKTPSKDKQPRSSAAYSSRIIKAGALIGDTKMLLSHWDVTTSVGRTRRRPYVAGCVLTPCCTATPISVVLRHR